MYTIRGYAATVLVPIIENMLNSESGFWHIRVPDEDKWGLIELRDYFEFGLFVPETFRRNMRELIDYFIAYGMWEYDEILELHIYDRVIEELEEEERLEKESLRK